MRMWSAFALVLAGCGGGGSSVDADEDVTIASRSDFDEMAARETAREEVAADGYQGVGQPYGCTEDCSGHEAGFAYAADNPHFAGSGESQSFDEGVQAFEEAVDEKVEEARGAYEDDGEDG